MRNPVIFLILFSCVFYQPCIEARAVKKWITKKITPKPKYPSLDTIPVESNIVASDDPDEQCKATVLPSFINNSMGWSLPRKNRFKVPILGEFGKDMRTGKTAYRGLDALSPPSIIITAAGNEHPASVTGIKTKASKNFDAIIVGSLNPIGTRTAYSRQGEAVHIMAPSDHYLTSINDDGHYRQFGGTSGATALVTGSLAGFEWLSGYHPTAEEAKILLERTAILTLLSHENPRRNGVGMVNAYKLGMVGQDLKRLCGKDVSCFKKMIQNPAIYRFPEDPGLEEAVEQAFPVCSRRTCGGGASESCVNKEAVFKRLRKASFLNSDNKKLWTYLACIYSNGWFQKDAEAMLNTYKALFGPPENGREAHTVCKSDSDCTLVPFCPGSNGGSNMASLKSSAKSGQAIQSMNSIKGGTSTATNEGFRAMTNAEAEMAYAMQCRGVSCNGKCRCDNEEEATQVFHLPCNSNMSEAECLKIQNSPNKVATTYTNQCVNSKCVLTVSGSVAPVVSPLPQSSPPSGQSSGQR